MGLNVEYNDGETPLDEDELEALLNNSIATYRELNEYEQQNIEQAMQWVMGRPLRAETIFTEPFVRTLHKRMYDDVWKWAGEFRKTNKNIGVDKWQIAVELKGLLDDAKYWLANDVFPPDELALRFKHRLVSIHCFPNGNGRHSRLMADIIIGKVFKLPVFTWGTAYPANDSDTRAVYLAAVRAADKGNLQPLMDFARG